jgi:hypothetical protein
MQMLTDRADANIDEPPAALNGAPAEDLAVLPRVLERLARPRRRRVSIRHRLLSRRLRLGSHI